MSAILNNLGLPFLEGDQASNARRNATIVMSAKGSEIAAIPSAQQIPVFRCIETSGGFTANELYVRTADNLGVYNVRRKHTHSLDTDEEGGTLHNILINNPRITLFGQTPNNNIFDFNVTEIGAAVFTYIQDEVYGRTLMLQSPWNVGSASGEYVNASIAGSPLGFDEKMLGIITMYLAYNANQVARMGFGMEEAQNTIDPARKVGMEMCGGTGINWQAVTANGLTRTTSATSMNAAPVPNSFKAYRMFFNPSNVSFKITNQDGIVKVMTSTIPSGGYIDNPRLFRIGLNTTNTQTKNLWVLRLFFVAKNSEPYWFDGPES